MGGGGDKQGLFHGNSENSKIIQMMLTSRSG